MTADARVDAPRARRQVGSVVHAAGFLCGSGAAGKQIRYVLPTSADPEQVTCRRCLSRLRSLRASTIVHAHDRPCGTGGPGKKLKFRTQATSDPSQVTCRRCLRLMRAQLAPPPGARRVPHPDDPRRVLEKYAVSPAGEVLSLRLRGWVPLRVCVRRARPQSVVVVLTVDGRKRTFTVAELVLRVFVGPRPLGFVPCHFPDPDRRNCRADNLRWVPLGTNQIGLPATHQLSGTSSPLSVLDAEGVRAARSMYASGFSSEEVAERLGVTGRTAIKAITGRGYADVPDPVPLRAGSPKGELSPSARLTWDDVGDIRDRYAAGESAADLARAYGVDHATLTCVIANRTWKDPSYRRPRAGNPKGELSPNSLLTWETVRAVRARYAAGEAQNVLAQEFGVSPSSIGLVVKGKTWVEPGVADIRRPRSSKRLDETTTTNEDNQ